MAKETAINEGKTFPNRDELGSEEHHTPKACLEISQEQSSSEPTANSSKNQAAVTVVASVVPAAPMMSEAEARQYIETIKSRFDDITALMLELDGRRGWKALGYKSMHQMIQAELKDHLNKSVSQIYRKLSEAKIRRELSQICEKVEAIPAYKLEPLGKLPPEEWQDAWEEVTSTAPDGKVRKEHVQTVVSRRIQEQKHIADSALLRLGDWVEIHSNQSDNGWDGLRGLIVEAEDNDGRFGVNLSQASGKPEWNCLRFRVQELIRVPAPPPYKVNDLVVIDIDHREAASAKEKKWNGFWGKVTQIGEVGSLTVDAGRDYLQLFSRDLKPIDAPSSTLRDVVERVLRLRGLELDEIEERMLDVFQRREWFTNKQMIHLKNIETLYLQTLYAHDDTLDE
jgi:hypothetical protein